MLFFTRWAKAVLLLILMLAFGSHVFAFETLEKIDEKAETILLNRIHAELPELSYEVTRETLDVWKFANSLYPLADADDGQRLTVVLKNVSQADCEILKSLFADARSGVDCSQFSVPADVNLLRFLDPVIQVSDGKSYNSRTLSLSPFVPTDEMGYVDYPALDFDKVEEFDSQDGIVLRLYSDRTECWGIAWQLATQSTEKIYIHSIDGSMLDNYFLNPDHVDFLIRQTESLKDLHEVVETTQYGDILIISAGGRAYSHVATFVDGQLLFERKGEFKGFLNRLISLDDITNFYAGYSYTIVRPKHAFPSIEQISKESSTVFGPLDESGYLNYAYEGETYFIYYGRPFFEMNQDESGFYRLGPKQNGLSKNLLHEIEQALKNPSSSPADLRTLIETNDFLAGQLSEDSMDSLVEKITNGYGELTAEQIILREIYVVPDPRPIP